MPADTSRTDDTRTDAYSYDVWTRLLTLDLQTPATPGDRGLYEYSYDARTRRVSREELSTPTVLSFQGGVSIQEYAASPGTSVGSLPSPTVEYVRGPDQGGGVGGILYSVRGGAASLAHSSARGDVVAKVDETTSSMTWQAQYEAFGRRPEESGANADRQRANSKDEDPTGLLNEGFRYRDLETGTFITRDPAGFVDGPNLYTYVQQNPWTNFDAEGLWLHVAAGFGLGVIGGLVATAVSDVVSGNGISSWETYASNAVGGGAAGATLAGTGSLALAGAVGGAARDLTQQGIDMVQGERQSIDLVQTAKATASGAAAGVAATIAAPAGVLAAGAAAGMAGDATQQSLDIATGDRDEFNVTQTLKAGVTGAVTGQVMKTAYNATKAGMEGYAQAALPPSVKGTTTGHMVTSNLQYIKVTNGKTTGARFPYKQADGHAETAGARALNNTVAKEGTIFHNNAEGTCPNCNNYTGAFLAPGKSLKVVPPRNSVPRTQKWNVNPKVHKNVGKHAYRS